ncbi:NUMOD3 domain-containing DNA-binding protein [Sinorhizobium sp. BJ1]|uniref:NUMOD3 domain-containing DNA-binding protein n=1 Tax=Sinorhizobium sp. BJ1 TaxID=2035455 RepID=UPI000BE7B568|nr:NUMOD3 domain-containing DNA-binding protein [Sinorhizobium sp. BJ1]PDT79954.1 hypothetical protein CO676_30370 [Sinorhizobium sp. BJ1]
MNNFYVYAWLRPCGTPFYIGKGVGKRDRQVKNNPIFKNILSKIKRSGNEPVLIRILENLDEDEAFEMEKALIKSYGRKNNGTGILANMTDGGDGVSGWVASDETRSKMSESQKGKVFSPETRKKIGDANKARRQSEGTRAKLSALRTGTKLSEDHRKKIGESLKGRERSEEHRAKLSVALMGNKNGSFTNLNISRVGRPLGDEHRAKMTLARRMAPGRRGYKGVSQRSCGKKWRTEINVDGAITYLGTYTNPEDAARAYDKAAYEAWGFNCYLNFPEEFAVKEAA